MLSVVANSSRETEMSGMRHFRLLRPEPQGEHKESEMPEWSTYARMVTALFVIANPVGALPLFISLTAGQTREERKRTAYLAAPTVALVLMAAAVVGDTVLQFFGIRIASFRVGGGILILLMAIAMLQARPSRTHQTPEEAVEAAEKEGVAGVPLGIPLIAGPGAIRTVIIYTQQARTWFDLVFLLLTSGLVAVSVWVALRLAEPISRALGKTGINIVTRLLGLMLAAVAVEFITGGLVQLLPGLAFSRPPG
jgi:multiple antibiotic resistance protein